MPSPNLSHNKRTAGRNCRSDESVDTNCDDDFAVAATGSAGGAIDARVFGTTIRADKNSNYNAHDCGAKTLSPISDKLANARTVSSSLKMTCKLDMVQEDSDCDVDEHEDILVYRQRGRCVQQQSLQSPSSTPHPNRLIRLRMHQFRRRSTSCDSWDHQFDTRYELNKKSQQFICFLYSQLVLVESVAKNMYAHMDRILNTIILHSRRLHS